MLTKIKNIIKIFFLKKNSSLHISTDLELNIMWLPRFCIKQSVFCPFSLWICTFSFLFSKDNSGVLWFPLWLLLLHTFPTPYPTHGQCQSPEFNLPNLSLTLTTVVIISYLIPPPKKMETILLTVVCPRLALYPVESTHSQWMQGKGEGGKTYLSEGGRQARPRH